MIEWLAFPLLVAGAAALPKGSNERKSIQTIFENTGYGITNKKGEPQFPKFKKKYPIVDAEEEIGTKYVFQIPLGLPATKMAEMEKKVHFFSDGLSRPVLVEFKAWVIPKDPRKYLVIKVFKKDIPELFPYKLVPECPVYPEDHKKAGENLWVIPLGKILEGMLWHDFEKIPHMTVAGTTRFGKTVFLKVLVTYLIEYHPQDVELYIIDLKGGLEFGRYKLLEQVKGVASNPMEAGIMLEGVHNQMQEEYKYFQQNYYTNISNTPIQKRKFIIVDEAAQLAPEKWMKKDQKEMLGMCQYFLGEITRIGGGLGYREVFCTQYPTSDTLPRSIKQNSDGKVSFRLPSGYASEVAIDERGAEELPSDVKGRGLYKTHELQKMQVPLLEDHDMWKRLERYQVPQSMKGGPENVVEYREKEEPAGEDLVKFG
ncbi:FtsK/SpoIIIE domain-containing protein [Cytobacillus oceanisediminis]|uniref:FtsK/SpoIIIE domain-containing protein n=1 Tax=Cytobacillus oceanisediminis TaxID=665099 RepID=UPI002079EC14|nr:FtsK/SpoIIIE domain-containing protein [Cytobacillus oceanisediminis]USK46369.1 hypothetical protein LIT27_11125 [Cytobacillus oceanisediminis]